MRIILIHNSSAGDEKLSGDELLTLIRNAGHEVIHQSIKDDDYKSALQQSADLVAIAGGDGTVRKVAMQLIGCSVPIAVLPMGTANNISKTLGIEGSPQDLIQAWSSARRLKFSVGLAKGPWGEARFIEGVGLGLFTTVMSMLDSAKDIDQLETAEEKLDYAVKTVKQTLSRYHPRHIKVILDGKDYSGKYLLLEAMNSKSIGPNLFLAPGADPTDDYLDFVLVREDHREGFADYLASLLQGKDCSPNCSIIKGRRLEVEWQGNKVRIDDQLWPENADELAGDATSDDSSQVIIDISLESYLEFLVSR